MTHGASRGTTTFVSGLATLAWERNNCYVLSACRMLLTSSALREYLMTHDRSTRCTCDRNARTCCKCRGVRCGDCLLRKIMDARDLFTVPAASLPADIEKAMRDAVQFDANEFLALFMDQCLTPDAQNLFSGTHTKTTMCCQCHGRSVSADPFPIWKLSIENISSLASAMAASTATEEDLSGYVCVGCRTQQTQRQSHSISRTGPVLIFHFKRSRLSDDGGSLLKIDHDVAYEQVIVHAGKYYRLVAVVRHSGTGVNGHFWADVLHDDQWVRADSGQRGCFMEPITLATAMHPTGAYMLQYQHVSAEVANAIPRFVPAVELVPDGGNVVGVNAAAVAAILQSAPSGVAPVAKAAVDTASDFHLGSDELEPDTTFKDLFSQQQLEDFEHAKALMKRIAAKKDGSSIQLASDAFGYLSGIEYHRLRECNNHRRYAHERFLCPTMTHHGFVWLPELMFPGADAYLPRCPRCQTKQEHGQLKSEGYAQPKRVVCAQATTWILFKNYECHVCHKNGRPSHFTGIDPGVIAQLPPHFARTYPFSTTSKAKNSVVVETSVMERFLDQLLRGIELAALREQLVREHEHNWTNQGIAFLHQQKYFGLDEKHLQPWLPQPHHPALWVPSDESLADLLLTIMESNDALLTKLLQQIDGEAWSIDHSHKVPCMPTVVELTVAQRACLFSYVGV